MQELTLIAFIALFQEMLGVFFWPLVFIGLFIVFAFIALLVNDKGFACKRFKRSVLFGVLGGFVGMFILAKISISSFIEIGGPIDVILVVSVYLGGFLATAITIYTIWGWIIAITNPGKPKCS